MKDTDSVTTQRKVQYGYRLAVQSSNDGPFTEGPLRATREEAEADFKQITQEHFPYGTLWDEVRKQRLTDDDLQSLGISPEFYTVEELAAAFSV